MFFEEERLPIVQAMILADTAEERKAHLDKLLPFQRADFEGLFEAMDGLPVIIRLIDPPLHEFLPAKDELLVEVTKMRVKAERLEKKGKKKKLAKLQTKLAEQEKLLQAVEGMEEANPMMGLRGIRLGITMPEITQMQVRAIFEAACNVAKKGIDVHPEIMIPLTGHHNELKVANDLLVPVAKAVMEEKGIEIDYKFGTMIEIPRAAVTADQVAEYAEFFSYGTNDLTQMTFGYSRDDAERNFLLHYVEHGILPANPFQKLDWDGVGELVKMGARKGRQTRPELEVGICGEHGGEPSSIEFCHIAGLNYVSCSPLPRAGGPPGGGPRGAQVSPVSRSKLAQSRRLGQFQGSLEDWSNLGDWTSLFLPDKQTIDGHAGALQHCRTGRLAGPELTEQAVQSTLSQDIDLNGARTGIHDPVLAHARPLVGVELDKAVEANRAG